MFSFWNLFLHFSNSSENHASYWRTLVSFFSSTNCSSQVEGMILSSMLLFLTMYTTFNLRVMILKYQT